MDEVIGRVFKDADTGHLAHLVSRNYAEHEALGAFYVDVRNKLDKLVEAALALDIPEPGDNPESADMLATLEAGLVELSDGRSGFCQGSTVLENLYDELLACYLSAIYKLKRLA